MFFHVNSVSASKYAHDIYIILILFFLYFKNCSFGNNVSKPVVVTGVRMLPVRDFLYWYSQIISRIILYLIPFQYCLDNLITQLFNNLKTKVIVRTLVITLHHFQELNFALSFQG